MSSPTSAPRELHRPPRCGIRSFRRRRRAPAPTRLGFALLVVILLLLGGVGVAAVRADDDPDPYAEVPRYEASVRGARPSVVRWRSLLEQYEDWDVATGLRVIDCESDGNPWVYNRQGSGAIGLFQLLGWERLARRMFGSGGDLTNPYVNVAVAHVLWSDSGGTFRWHWAASAGCWE